MADKSIFANTGATKPSVPKSLFDLSHANNMTAKFGQLYPCYLYDAPAGSSFHITPRMGFDLMPMNFPIQSNVRAHLKFYKIPKRILWDDYKDFVGQHGNHKIPYIARTDYFHSQGSLADYMGLPSGRLDVEYYNSFHSPHSVAVSSVQGDGDHIVIGEFQGFSSLYGRVYDFTEKLDERGCAIVLDVYTADLLTSTFTSDEFKLVYYHPNHSSPLSFNFAYAAAPAFDKWAFLNKNTQVNVGGVDLYHSQVYLGLSSTNAIAFNQLFSTGASSIRTFLCWTNTGFGTPSNWRIDHTNTIYQQIKLDTSKDPAELRYDPHKIVSTAGVAPNIMVAHQRVIGFENSSPFVKASVAADPKLPISALPFRAYEFIYNYFFLNERVTPFKINNVETYNKFITNSSSGADSTTPLDIRQVPYEFDMFTTCLKTPQFGNAPLVGITTNDLTSQGVFHMIPDGSDPYDIAVDLDTSDEKKIIGISNYDEVADKPGVARLQDAITFGISINDFRNVNCLQRFQERHLKAGTKYQNIVYEFFGTNPPIGEEFPEYLGGLTDDIIVNKIQNTAKSDGYELGEFAGTGVFRSKGKKIKTFCSEESYIMGVIYFTVTPTYPQQLPRLFTKTDLLDFYNPQFSMIGPQPVYKHELTPLQLTNETLYDIFGYNAPWSDYKSARDEVHGDFRGSLANYLLQRRFATPPSLNSQFLYIDSDDLTDIFSVTEDTDKIFGQIWFDVKAKLPIPRYSVPRII